MLESLSLHGWRQFRKVDLTFHPRLTVLTGANGAGKTTLLSLVSRHFGWSSQFISTPKDRLKDATIRYTSDYWEEDESERAELEEVKSYTPMGPQVEIGKIKYRSGDAAALLVPIDQVHASYEVHIPGQQHVEGLHIPSHRPTYSYQQVQSIPVVPRRRNEAFQQYLSLIRTRFSGGHTQWSPQYYMKETLVALANFGYGNVAVEADPESAKIFEDFQEVLRRMLPPKLGFRLLIVRIPEVVLDTDSGQFSFDAVSGGVGAVIDLAWQIFMYQPSGTEFIVTLDEPENHLHPEIQRRVLTDLLAAFPSVQFVVATHSPFIVGSVPDSNVYVLDYDESSKVSSSLLDTVNKAGTANEILREVLGLDFTMPVWVESQLERIVEEYAEREFTSEVLANLRSEMDALGLTKHSSETIARLAGIKDPR